MSCSKYSKQRDCGRRESYSNFAKERLDRGSGYRDIDAHAWSSAGSLGVRLSCACQSNSFDPIPHPFQTANMAASVGSSFFKGETGRNTRGLLRLVILVTIAATAVASRLFSVIRFESIIHECRSILSMLAKQPLTIVSQQSIHGSTSAQQSTSCRMASRASGTGSMTAHGTPSVVSLVVPSTQASWSPAVPSTTSSAFLPSPSISATSVSCWLPPALA